MSLSITKKINEIKKLPDKKKKNTFIKLWDRSLMVSTDFIGLKFKVHQGLKFINITVTEEMVGHRFGEFAPTRVRHEYKKKRSKGK